MKIYLDDLRPTPDGWIHAYWPNEVIEYLKTGGVEIISLDHDLGDDERGTGYDVVLWIEEAVQLKGSPPPKYECIVQIVQREREWKQGFGL